LTVEQKNITKLTKAGSGDSDAKGNGGDKP
jgi:hypothetical protein